MQTLLLRRAAHTVSGIPEPTQGIAGGTYAGIGTSLG